jgi:hypothetical protein
MRERKRKLGTHQLGVRLWTLKDKKNPMFRARYPDRHIVELTATTAKTVVILKEWSFEGPAAETGATAQYEQLVSLLA